MARVVTRSQVSSLGLMSTPPSSPNARLSLSAPASAAKSVAKRSPHKITLLSERRCSVGDLVKEETINGQEDSKIRPRALFNDEHEQNEVKQEPKTKSVQQAQPLPQVVKSGTRKKWNKTSETNGQLNGHSASKQDKLAKAAEGSHKLTEYFPIRRSSRRPKSVQEKATLEDLQSHLKSQRDEHLEVCDFGLKGRGVVALRDFKRGDFVVEYAGELVDLGQAKEREDKYACDVSTGCYMYYFKHRGKQYCIDATKESGRLGRLVNHSRLAPNLQTKVVAFNEEPRLVLVARRDVMEGEELLYDYGDRSKESLIAHPWLAT